MVDTEGSRPQTKENDARHDGVIDIGNHIGRLAEITRQPVPESFPVDFFALKEGRATLEQVRVIHLFVQEYRNKIAVPGTKNYLLEALAQRVSSGSESFRPRLEQVVSDTNTILTEVDQMTTEAEELLEAMQAGLQQVYDGDAQTLLPDTRDQLIKALTEEQTFLTEKKNVIDPIPGSERSDDQRADYAYYTERLQELDWMLAHYTLPDLHRLNQMAIVIGQDLESWQVKAKETPITQYQRQVADLTQEYEDVRWKVDHYQEFIEQERQKPLLPAETAQYVYLAQQLREAVQGYSVPQEEGISHREVTLKLRNEAIAVLRAK